jgi:hypothetical protein
MHLPRNTNPGVLSFERSKKRMPMSTRISVSMIAHDRPTILQLLTDQSCPKSCPRLGNSAVPPLCPPKCYSYTSTWDVIYKVVRQVSDIVALSVSASSIVFNP